MSSEYVNLNFNSTVHYTVYSTLYSTLYVQYSKQYNVINVQWLCKPEFKLHSALYSAQKLYSTLYSVQKYLLIYQVNKRNQKDKKD